MGRADTNNAFRWKRMEVERGTLREKSFRRISSSGVRAAEDMTVEVL